MHSSALLPGCSCLAHTLSESNNAPKNDSRRHRRLQKIRYATPMAMPVFGSTCGARGNEDYLVMTPMMTVGYEDCCICAASGEWAKADSGDEENSYAGESRDRPDDDVRLSCNAEVIFRVRSVIEHQTCAPTPCGLGAMRHRLQAISGFQ
ncbi:hypothetical protein B0T10DRAFT_475363 [Thelonectria olida]|uniref:Uncharacterized protein n=1 Tax=Thelonectria olida TaxID=1576542 RepID=A0A9P8WE33_9HYPO|nr:hypothetical protein B0T10DRAFT_475363 [Thelonectria olida]